MDRGRRLHRFVKSPSDKRKTEIGTLSYVRRRLSAMEGPREGMETMPALREISFEAARRIAEEKGLQPSKVKGTNTLRFSKNPSEKLVVISWDEFEETASGRRLAVYESGGWMKLMTKH